MSNDLLFDPFTTKDLLTIKESEDASDTWQGFRFDTDLTSSHLQLAEIKEVRLEHLRTKVLELSLDEVSLPGTDSDPTDVPSQSPGDNDTATSTKVLTEDEDLWACPDVQKPKQENKLISWDHFLDVNHESSPTPYISEAGSAAFDALLHKTLENVRGSSQPKYAKQNLLVTAIFDLGIGRESRFFRWNRQQCRFDKIDDGYTISGVSEQVLGQVVDGFLRHGTRYRRLEDFGDSEYCRGSFRIAFSKAVKDVLAIVGDFIVKQRSETLTLLQLQERFSKIFELVHGISPLLEVFDNEHGNTQLIADTFSYIASIGTSNSDLEIVLARILVRITQPAITALESSLGFSSLKSYAEPDLGTALGSSFPRSVDLIVNSVQESALILQKVVPATFDVIRSAGSQHSLSLRTSWEQISTLQEKATAYEQQTRCIFDNSEGATNSAIARTGAVVKNEYVTHIGSDPFQFAANIFEEQKPLSTGEVSSEDSIEMAVHKMLSDLDDPACATSQIIRISCTQALEFSFLPLITAQHRLTSYAVVQSLFIGNAIQEHCQTLWRFHLMSDGPFTSRLSTALFDAEQSSGEGRRKSNITVGLRLQSRATWPPASSELRLALLEILSNSTADIKDDVLSQSNSFAIRDLSDDELELCRDVNTIHALDFLRLSYKAPNQLVESVITPKSLKRYDRIFMYLLRLLRLKDLTQYLHRQACQRHARITQSAQENRHRREMHQFICALANYSHNIAINSQRYRFEEFLTTIRQRLDQKDYDGVLETANSLGHLRQVHEQTLDRISQALFLRKKQSEPRKLIEDIFGTILIYAAECTKSTKSTKSFNGNDNDTETNDRYEGKTAENMNLRSLYESYRKKTEAFILYLKTNVRTRTNTNTTNLYRNEDGMEHAGGDESEMMNDTLFSLTEQLLLALDFGGKYYGR